MANSPLNGANNFTAQRCRRGPARRRLARAIKLKCSASEGDIDHAALQLGAIGAGDERRSAARFARR